MTAKFYPNSIAAIRRALEDDFDIHVSDEVCEQILAARRKNCVLWLSSDPHSGRRARLTTTDDSRIHIERIDDETVRATVDFVYLREWMLK